MLASFRTLVAIALLLCTAPAAADTDVGDYTLSGWLELGGQALAGDRESAEFEEYRDVQEWIARGAFRLEQKEGLGFLRGRVHDIAQDDQFYRLEIGQYGAWGLTGSYVGLPHRFSSNAETFYDGVRDAGLTVPFARPDATNLGANVDASLQHQDLRFQTNEGAFSGYWKPLPGLALRTGYRQIEKRGTIYRGGLGHPFGFVGPGFFQFVAADFTSFATPVDERIHEITGDVEWSGEVGSVNLNYTGNLYDQRAGESLTVDNPLFDTDRMDISSRWRQALAPDNDSHTFSLSGAIPLREPFPMRLTATVSYGMRSQDEDFIPMTVNSFYDGLASLRPSENDLDGRINVWLGDVRFSARPHPKVKLEARYRIYDYDNDSDRVRFDALVTNDTILDDDFPGEIDRVTATPEYTKHDAQIETSVRVHEDATLAFGWDLEIWNRSSDRAASRTEEWGPRVRIDWRPTDWMNLRTRYSYSKRENGDYDAFDYFYETHNPGVTAAEATLGFFPELRKFPQADRRRHEASVIAEVNVAEGIDLHLNGGVDWSDYPESDFGLTQDEAWFAGLDASYEPVDWMSLTAYYNFDHLRSAQRSRQRDCCPPIPPADDPADDWTTRTTERAHNLGANLWLELVPDRLETEIGYEFQKGYVSTHSGGPNPDAVDWPSTRNTLHRIGTALVFHVDERLSLRTHYRFEKYSQRDFQFDDIDPYEPSLSTQGYSLFLGNDVQDYKAHIYGATIRYEF